MKSQRQHPNCKWWQQGSPPSVRASFTSSSGFAARASRVASPSCAWAQATTMSMIQQKKKGTTLTSAVWHCYTIGHVTWLSRVGLPFPPTPSEYAQTHPKPHSTRAATKTTRLRTNEKHSSNSNGDNGSNNSRSNTQAANNTQHKDNSGRAL